MTTMEDKRKSASAPAEIPILTDVISAETVAAASTALEETGPALSEDRLAELQTELAARIYDLADQLVHSAFQEMEAELFEQMSNRLRKELPELIDRILREHFQQHGD